MCRVPCSSLFISTLVWAIRAGRGTRRVALPTRKYFSIMAFIVAVQRGGRCACAEHSAMANALRCSADASCALTHQRFFLSKMLFNKCVSLCKAIHNNNNKHISCHITAKIVSNGYWLYYFSEIVFWKFDCYTTYIKEPCISIVSATQSHRDVTHS